MYSNPPMDYPYHTPSYHPWSIPPTYSTNPSFTSHTTSSFPSFPWELFTPCYTHGSSSPSLYPNHGYSPHPPNPNPYSSSPYSYYYNNHHQQLQPTNTFSTIGHQYQIYSRNRRDFEKYLQVSHLSCKKRSKKHFTHKFSTFYFYFESTTLDSENHTSEEHLHPHPLSSSKDEFENLDLHETLPENHDSLLSDSQNHHLSPPSLVLPADSDPFLAPPQQYREITNPNSSDNSSYIDPPSYADAIFSSFDGETSSNGVDTHTRSSSEGLTFSRSSVVLPSRLLLPKMIAPVVDLADNEADNEEKASSLESGSELDSDSDNEDDDIEKKAMDETREREKEDAEAEIVDGNPVIYDLTYLLKLCGENLDYKKGSEIHGMLIVNGFDSNLFAMTSFVKWYVKYGKIDDAFKMFDRMPHKDSVSWNTVVAGYAHNGFASKALWLVLDTAMKDYNGQCVAAASLKTICLKELYNGQCFGSLILGAKNLKTLKLFRCSGDWNTLFTLMAERVTSVIADVHFERLQISDIGLQAISHCSNLEILHLVKTPECTDLGLVAIAEQCKLLRKLHIDGWKANRIGDEGLIAVAKFCPNLQELVLIGVNPTTASLEMLASNCPNLERLALCASDNLKFGIGVNPTTAGISGDVKSSEDPIYKGYKAVLDSKSTDETLALHASWEPRYFRYCHKFPSQQYVKVGTVLRQFGYTVVALHGCLRTEIQTPQSVRVLFKDPCLRLAAEVSKVLIELANSIRSRRHCSPEILSDHLHEALQDLNTAIKSKPRLFLSSKDIQANNMLATIAAAQAGATEQITKHGKNALPSVKTDSSALLDWKTKRVSSEQTKDVEQLPERKVLRSQISKIVITSLEFSGALPFAVFASLLVETVAKLNYLDEVVATFRKVDYTFTCISGVFLFILWDPGKINVAITI